MADYVLSSGICQWQNGIQISVRHLDEISGVAEDDAMEVFENDYKDFQGAYAQGILIGGEAPELGFLWTSQGNYRKLSDLRGKIVVVDFWATWCGPCVRAFPNVRKLQERYKDYDVVIIGVTSVQAHRSFGRKESHY